MRPLSQDLSIYRKFSFEKPPVGIKYLLKRPEGMEQLDKELAFCEMVKEAQQRGTPFYFGRENEDCAGKSILGMIGQPPSSDGGQYGVELEIFQEGRANLKVRQQSPRFEKGTVNYVAYSPLDKLTFEPDLLVLTATISQAEIVMRAISYSTGEIWSSNISGVGVCSWLFVYPYQSGKVNYMVTGLTFGAKAKQIFEEGWVLISIPYHWIPTITQNLTEMKWVLPSYTDGREKFMERDKRIKAELAMEFQNP
jgi:uncharacterized protein (DUF169 family)